MAASCSTRMVVNAAAPLTTPLTCRWRSLPRNQPVGQVAVRSRPPPPPANMHPSLRLTREERSWVLYDVANSAFVLVIVTAIMPLYV